MSVAFVREESAEAAREVILPERPISTRPNLVTQIGFQALEQAVSREALRAVQLVEDANERRRALELAARRALFLRTSCERRPYAGTDGSRGCRVRPSGYDHSRRRPPSDLADCWRGRGRSPRRLDLVCFAARAPPDRQTRRRFRRHG
jgi:hypothetical protein